MVLSFCHLDWLNVFMRTLWHKIWFLIYWYFPSTSPQIAFLLLLLCCCCQNRKCLKIIIKKYIILKTAIYLIDIWSIVYRSISINTNSYKSWKLWFSCIMSVCLCSSLEDELWLYPLRCRAEESQEVSSSILASTKSVASIKHRNNTSKEKSVFWYKSDFGFFFFFFLKHPTPPHTSVYPNSQSFWEQNVWHSKDPWLDGFFSEILMC